MIKGTRIVNDAVFLIDDNHASGISFLGKVQSGWDIAYSIDGREIRLNYQE